jgi:putative transposase
MKRFKSARQVQRFLSIHDPINNLVHLRCHRLTAARYSEARSAAFEAWAGITSMAFAE